MQKVHVSAAMLCNSENIHLIKELGAYKHAENA